MSTDPFLYTLYSTPEDLMPENPASRIALARETLNAARATTDPEQMDALFANHFFGPERHHNTDRGADVGIIFAAEEMLATAGIAGQTGLAKQVAKVSERFTSTLTEERPVWSFVQADRFGKAHVQDQPSRLVEYQPPNPFVQNDTLLSSAIAVTMYSHLVDAAQNQPRNEKLQQAVDDIVPVAGAGLRTYAEQDNLTEFLQTRMGKVVHTALGQAAFFNFMQTPESDGSNLLLFTSLASKLGNVSPTDMLAGRQIIQKVGRVPTRFLLRIDL